MLKNCDIQIKFGKKLWSKSNVFQNKAKILG